MTTFISSYDERNKELDAPLRDQSGLDISTVDKISIEGSIVLSFILIANYGQWGSQIVSYYNIQYLYSVSNTKCLQW
jgi:hypothetical protein